MVPFKRSVGWMVMKPSWKQDEYVWTQSLVDETNSLDIMKVFEYRSIPTYLFESMYICIICICKMFWKDGILLVDWTFWLSRITWINPSYTVYQWLLPNPLADDWHLGRCGWTQGFYFPWVFNLCIWPCPLCCKIKQFFKSSPKKYYGQGGGWSFSPNMS